MAKSLVIAEEANLAALMDRGKAIEFFFQNNGFSVGDIYTARVENILPSIDAVFVSLGTEKMGFLHASDIPGSGPLSERIWPKQKLLVQVVKEPTGNKGPRVSTDITLIGRFFVLTTENDNIVMSRRISSPQERARLKSIATLLKPPVGFGLVIRTEAMGATEKELEEDFRDLFLDRWKYVIDQFEVQRRPGLILSDSKDLLYRVLRDVFHDGVEGVYLDNERGAERAKHYLELWSHNPPEVKVSPTKQLLKEQGVLDELKTALSHRIELPSGGYLHIQPTEALTVVDVNSGKFTSSRTPGETVLRTNLEAATEASRQLRLRNIGGVIVIDFIDMDNKFDRLTLLEHFEKLLETDPVHPQIGRLSDLGLVELTRHRQEKSLFEALGETCNHCGGVGWVFPIFKYFADDQKPESSHQCSSEEHHDEENFGPFENEDGGRENQVIPAPPLPEAAGERSSHQQSSGHRNRPERGGERSDRNDRGNRFQQRRSLRGNRGPNGPNNRNNFGHQGPSRVSELEEALIAPLPPAEVEETVAIENVSTEQTSNTPTETTTQIKETPQPEPEIIMPTISFTEKTEEVLPGIFSFSSPEEENNNS